MKITGEDIQKARRLSQAIQKYLEMSNENGVRSNDIYPYLARVGLVEKDLDNGKHFRQFLQHLKDNDLLYLIPQCQYRTTRSKSILEWYFYQVTPKIVKSEAATASLTETEETDVSSVETPAEPPVAVAVSSAMTDVEIDARIPVFQEEILAMPKMDTSKLTAQKLEIRRHYARAYERWSERELEILVEAYDEFRKIDKVAALLMRQPSDVKQRLHKLQNKE